MIFYVLGEPLVDKALCTVNSLEVFLLIAEYVNGRRCGFLVIICRNFVNNDDWEGEIMPWEVKVDSNTSILLLLSS